MNRLNIYSDPTKIQPRSVNTLSIIATLTTQDWNFNSFKEILVIFLAIFGDSRWKASIWGWDEVMEALAISRSLRIEKSKVREALPHLFLRRAC